MMNNWNKLLLAILTIACVTPIIKTQGQVRQATNSVTKAALPIGVERLTWGLPTREVGYDGTTRNYLKLDMAEYDDADLPMVLRSVRVGNGNTVKASLISTRFEPLTIDERNALGSTSVSNDIKVNVNTYIERKQRFARVTFTPLRKNPATGQIEKLMEFRLVTQEIPSSELRAAAASSFSSSSQLGSGTWYKVAIAQDGIYRITYEELQQMGMDVQSIDPRRLSIFGNGGSMLPQPNSAFRYDDLVQNPIEVVGELDGSFDPGDYILFYGKGPHRWVWDESVCGNFRHIYNIYDNKAYYFITADRGIAPRISVQIAPVGSPTHTVNSFVEHQFHENDLSNLLRSGKLWLGELFDIQNSHSFDFGLANVRSGTQAHIGVKLFAQSINSSATSFNIKVNNTSIATQSINAVTGGYSANAATATVCTPMQLGSGNTNISLTFSKNGNMNAKGWLDYITIVCMRDLQMASAQMAFRDTGSVGIGNIGQFTITAATSTTRIWETTDPTNVQQMAVTVNGSVASFRVATDSLREFIAFNGSNFLGVEALGRVENQNIHGLAQADMIIVAHPTFMSEANRLAEFHRSNAANPLSVHVVTPAQVYNEFSSGAQDVTAIRDMMRMFYQRSTNWQDMPRYLLLFGDASFDYKDRITDNTNFVPSYQSEESLLPTFSFVSDDYFGLLDPSEGRWGPNDTQEAMDIGIGRFPVDNMEHATTVVDKIVRYEELNIASTDLVNNSCGGVSATVSPDWRNRICFVGDDEDGGTHMSQANQLAVMVDNMYPDFNISKILFDTYIQESTPGGQRYPEVTRAINNEVNRGVLIMNYTGHGGEVGWAHERVLGIPDITSWTNSDNLVVFVTATCEFSRHDDPVRISAGELCLLTPNGGAIALFTTTRLVYSTPNFALNKNFYRKLLEDQPWGEPTMGDVIRMTKVASGGQVNNRNFVLLGDPAQRLSYPLESVATTTVNGISVANGIDTLNALELVTIAGRMQTRSGQPLNDFNGVIYPTVFDKPSTFSTLGNDAGAAAGVPFEIQNNILYKGKASVVNGAFSFTFMVPKDIAYNYGIGRISYYAEGNDINASGNFEGFVIGGSFEGAVQDNKGPEVKLFMNDENFAFGGTTDENPIMVAVLRDSSGINTVGSGIGHDIAGIHNGNSNATIVLNDYYQADLDSYQSGRVAYSFNQLSEGNHNIRFKVWDVHNNSSEAYTEFVVAKSAELALEHVLNYPNPFTTRTQFMFEHNQPCNSLDVMVQVFTVSGKLVKTIHETVTTNGFRGDPIEWDGLDDYGNKIGRGVYVYNLKVTTPDGQKAEQIEKLVVLR